MNYWLHRISYEMNISYPLMEKGYLSIGFSDFCCNDFLEQLVKDDENSWNYFEEQFLKNWGNKPRSRYSLWRFIKEMKKGDWVLVPEWGGTFSIYELTDDNVTLASDESIELPEKDCNGNKIERHENKMIRTSNQEEDNYYDIGFLRKCKPVECYIPRQEYADMALNSRMKLFSTNANISDLKESIETAVEAFRDKKPINLKEILVEKTVDIWSKTIREKLKSEKYEKLVKWYFTQIGASEVYIPPKHYVGKQGDVDVVATFEKLKTIVYVQAKFYEGETSDWAVQQIVDFSNSKEIGLDNNYSYQFWVISSSECFSENCRKLATENHVRLINGEEFVRMLLDVGIESLNGFDK